jgi:hypothetical protein
MSDTVQLKAFVVIYSHLHGGDVGLYETEELALQSIMQVALNCWDERVDQSAPEDPVAEGMTRDDIIKAYFDGNRSESYAFEERSLTYDRGVIEQILSASSPAP